MTINDNYKDQICVFWHGNVKVANHRGEKHTDIDVSKIQGINKPADRRK